ncbi:MAG: putative DNA binding domain-containing protein [Candidatus Poribacteria bacterium]|nr:putative DNA binding domain-containing protein [Candidatus Poribacteria bacterium]
MTVLETTYPWYCLVSGSELEQGDILENCPVFSPPANLTLNSLEAITDFTWEQQDVIIMSQSCDLVEGREKIEEILLCAVWNRSELTEGHLSKDKGMEDARRGQLEVPPLLEMLIADMKVTTYGFLYAKLQLRVAKVSIHVNIATVHGKYVEAEAGGSFTLLKAAEALEAGQLTAAVDPMIFCENGVALLHLREFQTALESFDKALNAVPNPIQKAIVLNNKGWAFINLKQYQKAIKCFEEGIALDSDNEISLLRENKQVAEEYLARATDADNLTQHTQIRFTQGQLVPFEETRLYEFKEVRGRNPAGSIANTSDEYTVAFLNSAGGRIFWGIRDSDRITVGITLNDQQRDEARRKVSEKLGSIDPPISVEDWCLEFHNIYDLQGNTVEDLWVVELVISPQQEKKVFYTNSGELFVKTEGGKRKLLGPQVTEFIRRYLQNDTETP